MWKYVFRKYNPEYNPFFNLEKRRITNAISFSTKIEHIGSTSIPHLGGKGILDIAVGVSKAKIGEAKKKLAQANYEFREKAGHPERLFFLGEIIFIKTVKEEFIFIS